jgi:beta-glucanase (GH16 family)
VPPPAGQAWALDWSDEFNGTAVDTSKWQFIVGTRDSDQNKTFYQAANAVESDGTLKLYAKNESVGGASYTGAELRTTSAYSQRLYGYFEARIRYELNGPGFWCNFWMRGTNQWPPEFDHEVTTNHVNEIWNQFHEADKGEFVPVTYNGQWHTYAFAWLPGQSVQFYIDNQVTHTSASDPTVDMYPRLRAGAYDSAIWGGTPDGTTRWPGIAEYNWFRAWKLVPAGHALARTDSTH